MQKRRETASECASNLRRLGVAPIPKMRTFRWTLLNRRASASLYLAQVNRFCSAFSGTFFNAYFIQGNRFTVLQDVFTLPDVFLGEDSDCESEQADADGPKVSVNSNRGGEGGKRSRDSRSRWQSKMARSQGGALPSPRPDSFGLPEVPFGESSDSGSNGTEGDATSCAYSGSVVPFDFLPPAAIGEQGSDGSDRALEHFPAAIRGESLPWTPIGEESDPSDEGSMDSQERALNDDMQGAIPQVIVQPASSPVRMGDRPVAERVLDRLFDGLEFMHDSASPPPSSGAPSSWNTPSSAADASLPSLSPFLGAESGERLSTEDRTATLGIEDELARACAKKDAIAAEVSAIAAAEAVAQGMQEMPLASLPKYWNAYQYGLALRANQAQGVWQRMTEVGGTHGAKGGMITR